MIRYIEYFDYKQCLITLFRIFEIPKITIPNFAIPIFASPIFTIPIFTIPKNAIPNSEYSRTISNTSPLPLPKKTLHGGRGEGVEKFRVISTPPPPEILCSPLVPIFLYFFFNSDPL